VTLTVDFSVSETDKEAFVVAGGSIADNALIWLNSVAIAVSQARSTDDIVDPTYSS